MKKLVITAILVLSHIAFAAGAKEVTRMTHDQAASRVQSSEIYKKMEKLTAEGKSITSDPQLAKNVMKMLDLTLKDVVAIDNSKLMNLLNVDAKLVLVELARLASIVKDKNSNAQEIEVAKKTIELMALSANNIKTTARNSAEAQANKAQLKDSVELCSKVATFTYNSAAKEFQKAFESALEAGNTAAEAIKIAGKGKITEEQIRECKS